MAAPVCPNCGSSDAMEYGTVYTSYRITAITDDGGVRIDAGRSVSYDSYDFVEVECRDCGHAEKDPKKFLPQPDVVLSEN